MASEWLQITQFAIQQLHLGRGVVGAETTACFYHVHNPLIQILQTETLRNAPHGLLPGSETGVDWHRRFCSGGWGPATFLTPCPSGTW